MTDFDSGNRVMRLLHCSIAIAPLAPGPSITYITIIDGRIASAVSRNLSIRETAMLKMFRRQRKTFVWSPAVDFSDRRIAATLFSFPSN